VTAALTSFLEASVRTATPLALAALGELVVERAGVINIGLEGIVLGGAFGALLGAGSHHISLGFAAGCLAGIAVAGALVAGAICALLVRSAHQAPQPPASPAPMVKAAMRPPRVAAPSIPPQPAQNIDTGRHPRWAIVGAAYRKQADAEKRAKSIRHTHPALNTAVYPTFPGARRYLILFGESESQADAKRAARKARSEGAPRGLYVTRLD